MNYLKLIAYVILLFLSQSVVGNEDKQCQFIDSEAYSSSFVEIKNKAIKTSERLCAEFKSLAKSDREIDKILEDFIDSYEPRLLAKFPESDFPGITEFLRNTRSYLGNDTLASKKISDFEVRRQTRDKDGIAAGSVIFYYAELSLNKLVVAPDRDELCKSRFINMENCLAVFNDLARGLNAYRQSYVNFVTTNNLEELSVIQENWDNFAINARSQTILDIFVTSWIHEDHYSQKKLVSPASTQYFLLHPSIVYEHMDDAVAGERDEPAIALELFGINCWDCSLPIGISAAWIYTDRINTEDSLSKYSLMFHLKNQYSFGYTWRNDDDGGDGFYLSVDLLKALESKDQLLKDYKSKLK